MMRSRPFIFALCFNFVWINISEVARYLWIVRPALLDLAGPETAQMSVSHLAVWAVWDTILIMFATIFYALWLREFGRTVWQSLIAATIFWLGVFGLLWFGVVNMGLVSPLMIPTALPFAWIEQAFAALLTLVAFRNFDAKHPDRRPSS